MDVTVGAACVLSVFLREPRFQGQSKNRLAAAAEAHADGEVPLY
jgi:DNA gyrase/topoisomerase IV subunit B